MRAGGLTLGPVVFEDFEVPEGVQFGGKQRLAVHVLPGGGRVVEPMGADEGLLSWSGVFSGPSGAERARLLDELRRSGSVLGLSWAGWRYTVVIDTFQAESMNPAWLPYRLRACVVAVGDLIAAEALPGSATLADAIALGAGPDLAGQIASASAALGSSDAATFIGAAGTLAQLVTAQALLGAIGGGR